MITSATLSHPIHAGWITPHEQLCRLGSRSPLISIVTRVLPVDSVAKIVDEYVNYHFISSFTNWCIDWRIALENTGLLSDLIPPLPQNIHQILNRPCPIRGGHLKIKDTHVLLLIPACTVNDLARRVFGGVHLTRDFCSDHYLCGPDRSLPAFTQQPNLFQFSEPEWILISKTMIPGSANKNYRQQVQMIIDLRKKTMIDYSIPSFKYAFAANCLFSAITHKALWGQNEIRVQEMFYYNYGKGTIGGIEPYESNFTITNPYEYDDVCDEGIGVGRVYCFWKGNNTGVAALLKMSKPTLAPKLPKYTSDDGCTVS